jgi:hypothetical protein
MFTNKKATDITTEGAERLMGAIIRYSLYDYFRKIPKITGKTSRTKRDKIERMKYNKKKAELFFNKSPLFKLCNIDKEYLFKTYKKEIKNNPFFSINGGLNNE